MRPDPEKLAHDAIFGVKSQPTAETEPYSSVMEITENDRVLDAYDVCDRCGAAAGGYAELPDGELLFCDHHLRENAQALEEIGARVVGLKEFTVLP